MITDKQIREVVDTLCKMHIVVPRSQNWVGDDRYLINLQLPLVSANFSVDGIKSGKLKLKSLVEELDKNIENCAAMMRGRAATAWFEANRRIDFMFGEKEDVWQRAERLSVRMIEISDVLMKQAAGLQ